MTLTASGKEQFSGAVVKTREATPGKEIEAITRRMLDFSPRLKKLAGVPCQVYVRTVAANNAQPLTQDQCLRALHHLRVQSTSTPYPAYKFSSIQSVAMPYVGLISETHLAIIRLSPSHQFGHL